MGALKNGRDHKKIPNGLRYWTVSVWSDSTYPQMDQMDEKSVTGSATRRLVCRHAMKLRKMGKLVGMPALVMRRSSRSVGTTWLRRHNKMRLACKRKLYQQPMMGLREREQLVVLGLVLSQMTVACCCLSWPSNEDGRLVPSRQCRQRNCVSLRRRR